MDIRSLCGKPILSKSYVTQHEQDGEHHYHEYRMYRPRPGDGKDVKSLERNTQPPHVLCITQLAEMTICRRVK